MLQKKTLNDRIFQEYCFLNFKIKNLGGFVVEFEICPSILSADFCNLGKEISGLEKAGFKVLHFDVMDGHFVPNISFGRCVLDSVFKNSNLFIDVHLMVLNPLFFIEQFFKSKNQSITFHLEAAENPILCIEKIKSLECECGVAISPKTDVKKVVPYLDLIDMLLVMTVEPGFGGQSFMEDMLEKVSYIRNLKKNLRIEVDGGININNINKAYKKGANWFVAGSYIFKSYDYKNSFEELKKAVFN